MQQPSHDLLQSAPGTQVAVVGGGLGGLTTATLLARAGHRVVLFERSRTLGGRAATHAGGEFRFNIGPHALYRRGAAQRTLAGLGLSFSGGTPSVSGSYAVDGGVKHTLPGGFLSLLTTGLLRLPDKLEVARLLGTIQKIDPQPIQKVTVRHWLERSIRQPDVRRLLHALVRLATYANAPDLQSAGSALAQLQQALASNVEYLDGGWQTMVDALHGAALQAGVRIETGSRVVGVEHTHAVQGVRVADGTRVAVSAVVVAAAPGDAAALAPDSVHLRDWAATAVPIQAACLDLGLSRLPRPLARFALGIDQPVYFSVHSAVAKLAPPGGATVHVAKYLDPTATHEPKADERELERLADLMQPGWRDAVVERRFLPSMVVYNGLVTAAAGGVAGRPGPAVPDIDGLFVVGDWVGPEGLLADATVASAKQAVEHIARRAAARIAAAA
jgi:phytoene dehydrogenase-like protein